MFVRRVCVVAVLSTVVACAGGQGANDPMRRDFLRDASAICRDTALQIRQLGDEDPSIAGFLAKLPKVQTLARAGNRELRRLTPPEGDGATIDRFLDLERRGIDRLSAAGEAEPTDAAVAKAIEPAVADLQRAQRLAKAYGITGCTSALS